MSPAMSSGQHRAPSPQPCAIFLRRFLYISLYFFCCLQHNDEPNELFLFALCWKKSTRMLLLYKIKKYHFLKPFFPLVSAHLCFGCLLVDGFYEFIFDSHKNCSRMFPFFASCFSSSCSELFFNNVESPCILSPRSAQNVQK